METHKKYLNESSLSRLWRHNEKHDAGALTAFRKARDCGNGEPYSKQDNQKRNRSLLAKLKSKGYSVTTLTGTYPEGGKTTKEMSYFVVDIKDTGNIFKDLARLGEEFEQDSVLIIPKGTILKEAQAYLYGTNKCPDAFPGYHKKEIFSKGKFGYTSPIYTSVINGRPFIFEEVGFEICKVNTGFGHWGVATAAKKDWEDI